MVISEKSSHVSPGSRGWLRPEAHTLSVHEVGDGDRVVAVDLGDHAVEDSAGMGLARPDSHVLLAKLLELAVDGDGLLQTDDKHQQPHGTDNNSDSDSDGQPTSCSERGIFCNFIL